MGSSTHDRLHHESLDILTSWGSSTCEYLVSFPEGLTSDSENGPWPVLLFLTGHGEIGKEDKVRYWFESAEALSDFALDRMIVITPVVSWENALCEKHKFNTEALWLLFCTALSRLGA